MPLVETNTAFPTFEAAVTAALNRRRQLYAEQGGKSLRNARMTGEEWERYTVTQILIAALDELQADGTAPLLTIRIAQLEAEVTRLRRIQQQALVTLNQF